MRNLSLSPISRLTILTTSSTRFWPESAISPTLELNGLPHQIWELSYQLTRIEQKFEFCRISAVLRSQRRNRLRSQLCLPVTTLTFIDQDISERGFLSKRNNTMATWIASSAYTSSFNNAIRYELNVHIRCARRKGHCRLVSVIRYLVSDR